MKLYDRMCKVFDVLYFFTHYEYDFATGNTRKLYGELNLVDQRIFNFDINSIQWEPYMHDYVAGIRKYLLHESDMRIEEDRARYRR